MTASDLSALAKDLLVRIVADYARNQGIGSMSCTIYDTAWVSTVARPDGSNVSWCFPECFQYILNAQDRDGGWKSYATEVDGILNTAASLYALKKHIIGLEQFTGITLPELEDRIRRASKALQSRLEVWDVEVSVNVGFEILVPAMLNLLEKEGFSFHFHGRAVLQHLYEQKMSKFEPENLYGDVKMTSLHSLEAFIGRVDFDRIVHHKIHGSLMASPSSTTAYLMNRTTWDDEAEAYIRRTIAASEGGLNGGVPSAYPSTYFEFAWVGYVLGAVLLYANIPVLLLPSIYVYECSSPADTFLQVVSTLLENGFDLIKLKSPSVSTIENVFIDSLSEENGLVGFGNYQSLASQLPCELISGLDQSTQYRQ